MQCDPCEETISGWDYRLVLIECHDGEVRTNVFCERCYLEDQCQR